MRATGTVDGMLARYTLPYYVDGGADSKLRDFCIRCVDDLKMVLAEMLRTIAVAERAEAEAVNRLHDALAKLAKAEAALAMVRAEIDGTRAICAGTNMGLRLIDAFVDRLESAIKGAT